MNKRATCIEAVISNYAQQGRHDLPWRQPASEGVFNPYHILVSEVMLQQTQVSRVIPKYQAFLTQFPTIATLADASLDVVLGAWIGLGYNRRARYLWLAAQALRNIPEPWTEEQLVGCKGIGPNTARAVLVYTYDLPLTYIETNIRTVILHHFFAEQSQVSDKEIIRELTALNSLVAAKHPFREWYWALMDYGSHLKRTTSSTLARSTAYKRQSTFEGSRRQLRGKIIRMLHEKPRTYTSLLNELNDERFEDIITVLQAEKLVRLQDNKLMLYNGFDDVINK